MVMALFPLSKRGAINLAQLSAREISAILEVSQNKLTSSAKLFIVTSKKLAYFRGAQLTAKLLLVLCNVAGIVFCGSNFTPEQFIM